MLKKMSIKKILVSTSALFALFLVYLIPKNEVITLDDVKQELEYVDKNIITGSIYLEDSNSYLGKATVALSSNETDIEARAKELMEILIKDGSGESKIPNGFKSLIPSDTKILSIKYEDGVLKLNLSKELLDVSEEREEKIVEAIVYTLTSIEGIDKVILYVDGDILTKLPKTKINLPSTLDRGFGINKEYNLTKPKDITQVTVYYVSKFNENYYYVPVTKYINDDREKIKIVIDELTGNTNYNSNLMSFLDSNTKLISVNNSDSIMELEFNNSILNNLNTNEILEEVIYTISLSIDDNYDVDAVVFSVENEEIYKTVLKEVD